MHPQDDEESEPGLDPTSDIGAPQASLQAPSTAFLAWARRWARGSGPTVDAAGSVESDPFLVATCHYDFCQKRTGSVFQVGAYFSTDEELEVRGEIQTYNGLEIDGVANAAGDAVTYSFCPTCGSTIYWIREGQLPLLGIAVGNFVDPAFTAPTMGVHTELRSSWKTRSARRSVRRRGPTSRGTGADDTA